MTTRACHLTQKQRIIIATIRTRHESVDYFLHFTQTYAAVRSWGERRRVEVFCRSLILRLEQLPAGSQRSDPLHGSRHLGRTLNAALRVAGSARKDVQKKFGSPLSRHVVATALAILCTYSIVSPCAAALRMRKAARSHKRAFRTSTGNGDRPFWTNETLAPNDSLELWAWLVVFTPDDVKVIILEASFFLSCFSCYKYISFALLLYCIILSPLLFD